MTLGGSILLFVLGAVLFFAMDARWGGMDLDTVGVILMIAGGLGLFLSMFLGRPASTVHRDEPHLHH